MTTNIVENLSAREFATLLHHIKNDYAEGRVVICEDGWVTSRTEWDVLHHDAAKTELGST